MDRYAEGFHLGPYFKYRFWDIYDPTTRSIATGQTRLTAHYGIFGALFGYQYVKSKYVTDVYFGFGLGNSNLGYLIAPDIRGGLSLGNVLLN
jgi:hypothetical protein